MNKFTIGLLTVALVVQTLVVIEAGVTLRRLDIKTVDCEPASEPATFTQINPIDLSNVVREGDYWKVKGIYEY